MAQQIQMTFVSQFPLYKLTEAVGKDRNSSKQRLQLPSRGRASKTSTFSNFKMILKQKVQMGILPAILSDPKKRCSQYELPTYNIESMSMAIKAGCAYITSSPTGTFLTTGGSTSKQLRLTQPGNCARYNATTLHRYSSLQLPVSPHCVLSPSMSIRD